jgi:general secretion pathway protein N
VRPGPPRAALGWSLAGILVGVVLAVLVYAPAAWLAEAVGAATDRRFLLVDAQGSIWTGSAVPVLTGGADSRDAMALPGRLSWKLRPRLRPTPGFELRLSQPCCLNGQLRMRIQPGLDRLRISLPNSAGPVGQWPASWLTGLGTPWNTLQLRGAISLASNGLEVEFAPGRLKVDGRASLELQNMSSRLSTLDSLGSYRLAVGGDSTGKDSATLALSTSEGSLKLTGIGQWSPARLRFRGDARASEGAEAVLNNLLNIIGRRQGALSIISIG